MVLITVLFVQTSELLFTYRHNEQNLRILAAFDVDSSGKVRQPFCFVRFVCQAKVLRDWLLFDHVLQSLHNSCVNSVLEVLSIYNNYTTSIVHNLEMSTQRCVQITQVV